jgi:hypothetical protein
MKDFIQEFRGKLCTPFFYGFSMQPFAMPANLQGNRNRKPVMGPAS